MSLRTYEIRSESAMEVWTLWYSHKMSCMYAIYDPADVWRPEASLRLPINCGLWDRRRGVGVGLCTCPMM